MKKLIVLIVSLVLISPVCYAEPKIEKIKQDESSPYDGFVINHEMELKLRTINEEKKNKEEVILKLKDLRVQDGKLIETMEKRVTLHQELNVKLIKAVERKENEKFWVKTIYFIGGALITGLVSYGAARSLR